MTAINYLVHTHRSEAGKIYTIKYFYLRHFLKYLYLYVENSNIAS